MNMSGKMASVTSIQWQCAVVESVKTGMHTTALVESIVHETNWFARSTNWHTKWRLNTGLVWLIPLSTTNSRGGTPTGWRPPTTYSLDSGTSTSSWRGHTPTYPRIWLYCKQTLRIHKKKGPGYRTVSVAPQDDVTALPTNKSQISISDKSHQKKTKQNSIQILRRRVKQVSKC